MLEPHFAGAVIVTLALLVVTIHVLRLVRLALLHHTLRRALAGGAIDGVELLERLLGGRSEAERDALEVRNGAVLIAVAAACVGFGWLQGDPATLRLAAGISLFPLFVGAVLVVRGGASSRRRARDVGRGG